MTSFTKSNDWERFGGQNLANGANSGIFMSPITALVSLPEKAMARIDKPKGPSGEGRSDIIRANGVASLGEKGYPRGG